MRTLYFVLFFLLILSKIITANNNNKNITVINGLIENSGSTKTISLSNNLVILPSENYITNLDSNGYFRFKIDISGLGSYWLSDNTPHGIPLLLDKGDSIFIRFEAAIKKNFPEFIPDVRITGIGAEKNQNMYVLFKNRIIYQDSVYLHYMKKLRPFDYKAYCFSRYKLEKERILDNIKASKINRKFRKYALFNNKFFWIDMLFQYSFRVPKNMKELETYEYVKYLDSLNYFKFINTIKINSKYLRLSQEYGFFIRNYHSQFYITNNKYSNLSSDNERLDFLQENLNGHIEQLFIAFYINRYYKFESKEQRNDTINRYIKKEEIKERLIPSFGYIL